MVDLYRTLVDEWREKQIPLIFKRRTDLGEYTTLEPKKIIVVSGFRRTGKTYLLLHLIMQLLKKHDKEEVLYFNFEDERIPLKTEFLTELLPRLKEYCQKKQKYLFLDEIQNIPDWSKWLRRVYDTENIRIFVTGSSSKMSSKEIPTELRGRFLQRDLFPLDFQEFLSFKQILLNQKKGYTAEEKIVAKKALREYLQFGGLPEVVLAPENKKEEILHNYYNTVIRRDIIERWNIRNEESLKALLNLLLNSSSYSVSKMYNTLKSLQYDVGKGTIQNYIQYIENAYFLYPVPFFSFTMKDQLQYPRKVYFVDTGFLQTLSTKFSKNMGRNFENLVFLELKRRKQQFPQKEIFYWKSEQYEEVDFVIKDSIKVTQLIQVCYDITDYDTKKREIKALLKASEALHCKNILIITEDIEGVERIQNKKIVYIPLWKWLLS